MPGPNILIWDSTSIVIVLLQRGNVIAWVILPVMAHSQGASVYVSIGGWSLSDAFQELSANDESRRTFAMNCVGLIREYNFDGIGEFVFA